MAAGVETPSGEVQQAPSTADGEDLEQAGHMRAVVAVLEKAYDELLHADWGPKALGRWQEGQDSDIF